MELIEGTPFGDHLDARGSDPTPEERAALLRDALARLNSALSTLHAEGLLHRDIKSENVLIEPGGRLVLLDCGLVSDFLNPAGIRSLQRVLAGTPAYMSPEQSLGDRLRFLQRGRHARAGLDWPPRVSPSRNPPRLRQFGGYRTSTTRLSVLSARRRWRDACHAVYFGEAEPRLHPRRRGSLSEIAVIPEVFGPGGAPDFREARGRRLP